MSHLAHGTIENLECEMDELIRALQRLLPKLAPHIETDPNGKLSLSQMGGELTKPEYQIAIRKKDKEGRDVMSYCDAGFKIIGMGSSGHPTWGFAVDKMGLPVENLANKLKKQVLMERMENLVKKFNAVQVSNTKEEGGKQKIILLVPQKKTSIEA